MNLNTKNLSSGFSGGFIPFARPDIGKEEEEAALRVLRSGWLTTGAEAKAFEEEFARYVGASHALAVNSATAGLHLALEAAGVESGGRVITSPYTFAATAEVVRYLGAEPLFVDVEPGTFHIDPSGVEKALKACGTRGCAEGRVGALVPVHIAGQVCRMESLTAIARRWGIPVVEDAAHSFPSRTASGFAGTLGDMGVYSFYATKTITTGEGGMVVTNNEAAAKRISLMRLHGIDREIWNRYTERGASWKYAVVEAGFKYNMTDLAAAIGRVQLRRAGEFLAKRQAIAAKYRAAFADKDYIELPPDGEGHALHLFIIRLVESRLTLGRDEFIDRLAEKGVGTSVHFIPLHIHPYWQKRGGYKPEDFPHALDAYRRAISLPIYPAMTEEETQRVIEAVIAAAEAGYTGP
ncbi:MAG: DegT/DnrJ/EryC1/StrS family aminotransferase [Spirochaetales bacterium]|jgi:dTDP-4-amino-4,6-dideoxygalactose transaminase|nr:DegT/DnrJ/EryC1/StrS family aminotransferase [Spirochaetales bacterium]